MDFNAPTEIPVGASGDSREDYAVVLQITDRKNSLICPACPVAGRSPAGVGPCVVCGSLLFIGCLALGLCPCVSALCRLGRTALAAGLVPSAARPWVRLAVRRCVPRRRIG